MKMGMKVTVLIQQRVRGLADGLTEENPRQGELIFKDVAEFLHTLKIVANHTYPIPDGSYALIGCSSYDSNDVWVVGWRREDGKFEKLSVFSSQMMTSEASETRT